MTISAGRILIAEPFLGDKHFERSVVLLCLHDEAGSFGLVLNQTSELMLMNLVDDIYGDFPLHIGGPVEQDTLHFIHRLGEDISGSVTLGNGIYWSGDFDQVRQLINLGKIKHNDIRFFIGYSGWGEGQLERELSQNAWITSNIDADTVFDAPIEQFWRTVLKRMGGEYKVLANYPTDPRLN